MKIPYFLFALLLCLLMSCGHKQEIPDDVIPLNRMKLMIWDLEIADQRASDRFPLQKDSLRMESTSLYQPVFAKYKTNKTNFYKSFAFYESHPGIMKILFDSVSEYGNRQKAALYKKSS